MIIVSVILLSAQDGRSQELARMEICNMGSGTATIGDYSAETLRGRSTEDFARRTRQRIAYVSKHPRQREHVWNLVAKCLRNLRYGGDWKEAELPTAVRQLVSIARQIAYAEHGAEDYCALNIARSSRSPIWCHGKIIRPKRTLNGAAPRSPTQPFQPIGTATAPIAAPATPRSNGKPPGMAPASPSAANPRIFVHDL